VGRISLVPFPVAAAAATFASSSSWTGKSSAARPTPESAPSTDPAAAAAQTRLESVGQVNETQSVQHEPVEKRERSTPLSTIAGGPVPPSSICLERHSHISDLSCAVPDGMAQPRQRHRSMGNDSVAEIQKALSKVQADLEGAHAMGKKVSRVLVMKKLLEVAETIESQEDRVLLQRKLSRLPNDPGRIRSDSSSVSSDLQRRGPREVRRVKRSEREESSLSDSLSDDSSFSEWLAQQEDTKGHWQRILDMLGLSYFWLNDDELDREWDEFTMENRSEDEDDIPSPPIIETLSFVNYVKPSAVESPLSRSNRKLGEGITSRRANESNKNAQSAEEEQMLRELEEMEDKIKTDSKFTLQKNKKSGERLKRLGNEMKKDNDEVTGKLKIAQYERKAREAAQLKAIQAKLDDSREKTPLSPVNNANADSTLAEASKQLEPAAPAEPSLGARGRSMSRLANNPLLKRRPSWHRQRTPSMNSILESAVIEAVAVPRLRSADLEDGVLSLGSIDSEQFWKPGKGLLSDRSEKGGSQSSGRTELDEAGLTYTQKVVLRKNQKKLDGSVGSDGTRKEPDKEDETRSDRNKVTRSRNRNSRPPLPRKIEQKFSL
jgi:hypothetical protein